MHIHSWTLWSSPFNVRKLYLNQHYEDIVQKRICEKCLKEQYKTIYHGVEQIDV